jgi:hypothetical protein
VPRHRRMATDNHQAVHLMPTQANAYVMVLTNGKVFSNLPEHTWSDYVKMADKLPNFVQYMSPLPPMPAPPQMAAPPRQAQVQTQQTLMPPQQTPMPPQQAPMSPQQHQGLPPDYKQSQRAQSGCCPAAVPGQTCCTPTVQARPWPMPPINAPSTY